MLDAHDDAKRRVFSELLLYERQEFFAGCKRGYIDIASLFFLLLFTLSFRWLILRLLLLIFSPERFRAQLTTQKREVTEQ